MQRNEGFPRNTEYVLFRAMASMLGLPEVPATVEELIRFSELDEDFPLAVDPRRLQLLTVKIPVVSFMLHPKVRKQSPAVLIELEQAAESQDILLVQDALASGPVEQHLWALFPRDERGLESFRKLTDRWVLATRAPSVEPKGGVLLTRLDADNGPLFLGAVKLRDLINRANFVTD